MKMDKNKHNHSECLKLFARLSEYLDNELDHVTCQEIERHMADCPPCQACLATLKRTVALCKNMADQPVPQELSLKLKDWLNGLT